MRFTELGITTLREPQHPLLDRAGYTKGRELTRLGRLMLDRLFPGGTETRTQDRQRPRHGLLVAKAYEAAPNAEVPPTLHTVEDEGRLLSPHPHGDEAYGHCPACGYEGFDTGWPQQPVPDEPMVEHHTPDCPAVDAVLVHFADIGLTAAGLLKCYAAGTTVVLVPGDRKVRIALPPDPPPPDLPVGYIGPMGLHERGITVLADHAVKARPGPWATGANKPDHHFTGAVLGRDFQVDRFGPFATLAEGDPCPTCATPMTLTPAFEVRSARGTVGATRALQLLAEVHHDDAGLVWPPEIAPFTAHLITIGSATAHDRPDVLWDDRDASAGRKFADADLIGLPIQLIHGNNHEVKDRRTGERRYTSPAVPFEF